MAIIQIIWNIYPDHVCPSSAQALPKDTQAIAVISFWQWHASTRSGDRITHFTYAVFDGDELRLMKRNGYGPLSAVVRITVGPAV